MVTVIDTVRPTIQCPIGVSVNTEPGACTATGISLGSPTFTDNCSVGLSITNNAPVTYPIRTTNVTWTVIDESGNTSTCIQTVFVGCTPLAVNDNVSTPEFTPITVSVLANDIDCGTNLKLNTLRVSNPPHHGTVSVNNTTGTITYSPEYLFVGQDQFEYEICDSLNLCSQAIVFITVTPVNHPVLGIAKAVSKVVKQDDGSFNISYVFTAENLGNDVLRNIQITDNLTASFPLPAVFKIVTAPYTNSTITTNAAFNGTTDINLLDSSASFINIEDSVTVELTINVAIWGYNEQTFYNSATGYAIGSDLGIRVTDISENGYVTDINGDGNAAEENTPTPVTLTPEDVTIPNGFSPDGDGINDIFVIRGIEDYPDSKLSVFNRWGTLVYSQVGYKNDWDGKQKLGFINQGDEMVPQGTYFYILEYNKDNRKPINGFVVIQY